MRGSQRLIRNMKKRRKNYGITRIDIDKGSTHGWEVRLQRQNTKYAKFFADKSNKGKNKALAAARAYRDELLATLPEESRQARANRMTRRNTSGVVGVSRVSTKGSKGTVYDFWQASWSPKPSVRKCVKYSINRYGDKKAFNMASKARKEGVKAMEV